MAGRLEKTREKAHAEISVLTVSKWLSEADAVKGEFVTAIAKNFGVQPDCDAFSSSTNKRFSTCWTLSEDAFQQSWAGRALWINPPWSVYEKVVEKLERERPTAICITPFWPHRNYFKKLVEFMVDKVCFPAGVVFFELDGQDAGPTHWDVWAVLLMGPRSCSTATIPAEKALEVKKTEASRRRWRRKVLAKSLGESGANRKGVFNTGLRPGHSALQGSSSLCSEVGELVL
jgi:hypothetical protein